jgi:uncharacterized membrane protein
MDRSSVTALASILAIAGSLCLPGISDAQTTYTLTQIQPISGSVSTNVTSLNDEGDMALTVNNGPTVATYLWHRGIETNIGGLGPSPQFVESGGLNDLVQIVGTLLSPTSGTFSGYVWSQGHMTELPTPAGTTAAFGIQINLLGQIVGQVYDANFNAHAALWSHGTLTLLPGIPGGGDSQPVGINIRGEIVGTSNDASNVPNAVVWRQGALTVLINNAIPAAINDEGQVVGTLLGTPRPFLWQNGVTIQLPALPGMTANGIASGINDRGQIVGSTSNVAVLWQNGTAIDLNSQIATTDPMRPYVYLRAASQINNLGQIVATGTDSRNSNPELSYLLTPAN